ncbi:MAG: NUDIX domain-containing protein [Bacilli bacterium]|nr:NUDIX domain-containing protein [Bacilli bacterium]
MEYLDYYDEDGGYIGYKTREEVHSKGLWHKTIHCWLYDNLGNIYFQIRKDSNTFYTTASGHVLKGETVKDAFKREIKEEIGIKIDSQDATLVGIVPWKMDKVKKDGSIFKDRAWANVYVDLFEDDIDKFNFDENEVLGLVRVNAKEALSLFKKEEGKIPALIIKQDKYNKIVTENRNVNFSEFLVNEHETAYGKYSDVLKKVIELTER